MEKWKHALWIKVNTGQTSIMLGVVYRPSYVNEFFINFVQPLEKIWLKYQNIVVLGDFNCDIYSTSNVTSSHLGNKLINLLNQYNFKVHNDTPTRITSSSATLIDLVISKKGGLVRSTGCRDVGISDHNLVYAPIGTKFIDRDPR